MKKVSPQDNPTTQTLQQVSLVTLARALERYRTHPMTALKAAELALRLKNRS